MKSVSGQIVSSKPISLSKASNILSKFVSFENGASQPVSVYLLRASNAFADLTRFHKELSPRVGQKKSKTKKKKKNYNSIIINEEEDEMDEAIEVEVEEKKKKKNKRRSEEVVDDEGESAERKKHRRIDDDV